MSDDNRIPTETVMSDWAADNRILDAAQVRAQCHRVLNGGKPFREEAVSKLLDSHEALRAALATAEAERDTWKAYAARVAQEARDDFGVAEAAEERVGALEAALRGVCYAETGWLASEIAAARAVLAVPEGDAK